MNTYLYAKFREAKKWFLSLENGKMHGGVFWFHSIRILRLMISVVADFLIL